MIEYLETADRVLRVEVNPGAEVTGHCRRTFSVSVEAGAGRIEP